MESEYYRARNQQLFSVQLDFVSALANPGYVVYLAQHGYLQDARFIRYLEHLHSTWTKPEYVKFIRYPYALYFLQALQQQEFRDTIGREGWDTNAKSQMLGHWASWRSPDHKDEFVGPSQPPGS